MLSNTCETFESAAVTQLTFTCSKSTIETPEKGVKYDVTDVVLVFLLLTYFTPFLMFPL